jgi:hypothetical protein
MPHLCPFILTNRDDISALEQYVTITAVVAADFIGQNVRMVTWCRT